MKSLILIILTFLSFQIFSQECSQIYIHHIDHITSNSSTGEAIKLHITEDGNGDFYFKDINSLEISKGKSISILVESIRFFEFYNIEIVTSETDEKLMVDQSLTLCDSSYTLVIKVGERVIQSKSIILK